MNENFAHRHPILNKAEYQFVIVERMEDWANGVVTSTTYWQKVSTKGRPLKYLVIERAGAEEVHGRCDEDVIGATIAMQGGLDHWGHNNPKLALRWALAEAVLKDQVGPFEVLKTLWESKYGKCPFEIEVDENSSADYKSAYQMDLPGDKARPDSWEKLKDRMDTDVPEDEDDEESSGAKNVKNAGMGMGTTVQQEAEASKPAQGSEPDKTPERSEKDQRKAEKNPKISGQEKLKNAGYQPIPSSAGLWSKTGRPPAMKKLDGDDIKAPSELEQKQLASTFESTGDTQQPRVVKVVDETLHPVIIEGKVSPTLKDLLTNARKVLGRAHKKDRSVKLNKVNPSVGVNSLTVTAKIKGEIDTYDTTIIFYGVKYGKEKTNELDTTIEVPKVGKMFYEKPKLSSTMTRVNCTCKWFQFACEWYLKPEDGLTPGRKPKPYERLDGQPHNTPYSPNEDQIPCVCKHVYQLALKLESDGMLQERKTP